MKNTLTLVLRTTFSVLFFLSMAKSKIAYAQSPTFQSRIEIDEQNFSVKAPTGWKVRKYFQGKTLVFEDPLTESHDGTHYNRNITVAIQNEVRPIDSLEVKRLAERLRLEFGQDVSGFEVIDSRIIDYRAHADAILVYTVFKLNDVPMRQMHIFTSGSMNSVLLTFTDFQESFEAEGSLDKAWESMMSAEVSGNAPHRYDGLIYSGTGLAFLMSAAFLSKQARTKRVQSERTAEEDEMFDGDDDFEIIQRAGVDRWPAEPAHYAGDSAC